MIKLVVVGASGQLGTDICTVFADSSRYSVTTITRAQANLETPQEITTALRQIKDFDYLINCAALTNTGECERLPHKAYRINAEAVEEMANYCAMYDKTLFQFSTDYVFDGEKATPYREDDDPNPLNIYGKTKLLGEYAVRQRSGRYFIFRVSSLFGPAGSGGAGSNFVQTILSRARSGQELTVVSDQVMTPTHTLDVARTVRAVINRGCRRYGIYHCTSAGACSWYEFAVEILAQAHVCAKVRPVPLQHYPSGLSRPANSVLDTAKIEKYFPPRHWREALSEYLQRKGVQY